MEAYEAPITEDGDTEGEPGGGGRLLPCGAAGDSPEAYEPPVVEEGEGGDFAFLSSTALEALLRGSEGCRVSFGRRSRVSSHCEGALATPSLYAVFAAGLVGEGGEIMDPVPIIQTMEVEDDNVARDGLGVAEAATALPAEVVRAEYVAAAEGAVDRPGYDRERGSAAQGGVQRLETVTHRPGKMNRPSVARWRDGGEQGAAAGAVG
ncbi:hypothetical protein CYMTET_36956 [Cymbomonas tetramitiformis]|uniref:Uncharacterized protein n=1 Tax=Cymbomonas tetramitiformis TaxID=36881 RepID=A0AAE0F746_9CHLO|nr:hypothetical protein CYMTET_36956 [Cymbomonas tetramitiformis]